MRNVVARVPVSPDWARHYIFFRARGIAAHDVCCDAAENFLDLAAPESRGQESGGRLCAI